MASQFEDSIIERRAEFMKCSQNNSQQNFRIAHFLKPSTASSIGGAAPDFTENSSLLANINVNFNAWKKPHRYWVMWYQQLLPAYEPVWKWLGIHQALKNSAYCDIKQNRDLILGVAERWCSRTQSFVFPWGESTITLEDVMILGGYPVVGNSIFAPLRTTEETRSYQGLEELRATLSSSKLRKATELAWLNTFACTGSPVEHEAFLAFWLARLVFPTTQCSVVKSVFPVAVRLARGEKIALGPAVLAKIYNDLKFLKSSISGSNGEPAVVKTSVAFHLVQAWVWERFQGLRPEPAFVEDSEPRLARWYGKRKSIADVQLGIDSAAPLFYWRPYVAVGNNPMSGKFYKENEETIMIKDDEFDEELDSFVRCVRVSELVGMDCIEQYLPHRVAMQFGLDQDIPCHVPRANADRETAWRNYTRRVQEAYLFIPSSADSNVSNNYHVWWGQRRNSLIRR